MDFLSRSQRDTEELGRKLGALLKKGSLVALFGELGSGKTCFVRGVIEGACPESAHLVASPTFAIMNEYHGPIPVYHFDMYRMSGSAEIAELGFDDYFLGEGICIVEWAERLGDIQPEHSLNIRFEHFDDDRRIISLEATGSEALDIISLLGPSETTS